MNIFLDTEVHLDDDDYYTEDELDLYSERVNLTPKRKARLDEVGRTVNSDYEENDENLRESIFRQYPEEGDFDMSWRYTIPNRQIQCDLDPGELISNTFSSIMHSRQIHCIRGMKSQTLTIKS